MTATDILAEIHLLGSDSYKRVMLNHDVMEPFSGVLISDLQKIVQRFKKDYQLALDLYDTGNYDAMYQSGLIADDERMTQKPTSNSGPRRLIARTLRRDRPLGHIRQPLRLGTRARMD